MIALRTRPMWKGPVGFALVCSTQAGSNEGGQCPYWSPRPSTVFRVRSGDPGGIGDEIEVGPHRRHRFDVARGPQHVEQVVRESAGGVLAAAARRWTGNAASPWGPPSQSTRARIASGSAGDPIAERAVDSCFKRAFSNGPHGSGGGGEVLSVTRRAVPELLYGDPRLNGSP